MKLYRTLFEVDMDRKVSLGVLTYNNKVLIVQRSFMERNHPGKWGFPGGGIDHGETALQAIIRECEEEIGVAPINLSKLSQNGRITWFLGELGCDPAECIRLNWEHEGWALVGLKDIHNYDMIDGMYDVITKVLNNEII